MTNGFSITSGNIHSYPSNDKDCRFKCSIPINIVALLQEAVLNPDHAPKMPPFNQDSILRHDNQNCKLVFVGYYSCLRLPTLAGQHWSQRMINKKV